MGTWADREVSSHRRPCRARGRKADGCSCDPSGRISVQLDLATVLERAAENLKEVVDRSRCGEELSSLRVRLVARPHGESRRSERDDGRHESDFRRVGAREVHHDGSLSRPVIEQGDRYQGRVTTLQPFCSHGRQGRVRCMR